MKYQDDPPLDSLLWTSLQIVADVSNANHKVSELQYINWRGEITGMWEQAPMSHPLLLTKIAD